MFFDERITNLEKIKTKIYCREVDNLDYQVGLAFAMMIYEQGDFQGLYIDKDTKEAWKQLRKECREGEQIILCSLPDTERELDALAAIKQVSITSIDSSYTSCSVDWEKILPPEKTRGDRISEGQSQAAARKGHHIQIPYGYKKTKTGIAIDPEAVPYVRKMFDRCVEGKTNSEIAKELDDLGVLTPTGSKGWLEDTIHHILSNPI